MNDQQTEERPALDATATTMAMVAQQISQIHQAIDANMRHVEMMPASDQQAQSLVWLNECSYIMDGMRRNAHEVASVLHAVLSLSSVGLEALPHFGRVRE